jgi:hypothetical protein
MEVRTGVMFIKRIVAAAKRRAEAATIVLRQR